MKRFVQTLIFNRLKEHTPYGSRLSSGAFTPVLQESSVL